MEAQVLPFRRPIVVKFERFDVGDMAAIFTSKHDADTTYVFTLLANGECEEIELRRGGSVFRQHEFTDDERDHSDRLIQEAAGVHKEQLATWGNLGSRERISMLIQWGVDMVGRLKEGIQAAAAEDPSEHSEEIARMCADLENQEAYLSGLETARSLL